MRPASCAHPADQPVVVGAQEAPAALMSDPTKVLYDRVIDRVVSKLREAIERDGLDVRVADEVREVCHLVSTHHTILGA